MNQLATEIRSCSACGLAAGRTQAVPGEGPETASIMFIGEGPGFQEDRQGRPFVGPAGQFLEQLLASAGLRRNQVYIANVVKCRPPENRDPLPDEIGACKHWLDRQIELIDPKIIVTLGRFSMARWFPGQSISRIHGKPAQRENRIVFPMYHPAAALHQQSLRATIEEDMRKLPPLLERLQRQQEETVRVQAVAEPAAGAQEPQAQQLSLF